MDENELLSMLEDATSHCYDQEEEFWGLFAALVGRMSYPCAAKVSGQEVTLVGLHEPSSGLEKGVVAQVDRGGQEEMVSLAELELVDADSPNASWLEVYQYWLTKTSRA